MIPETMTIHVPYVKSLAITATELLESAMHFLNTGSGSEAWLTVFEVIALIVLVVLLFYEIARHRDFEHHLKEQIAELKATNENLRLEITELNGEEIDLLEGILEAEAPKKEIPGFNPQELKALSELAKRLR
jgi:uncharacterized membrane protein